MEYVITKSNLKDPFLTPNTRYKISNVYDICNEKYIDKEELKYIVDNSKYVIHIFVNSKIIVPANVRKFKTTRELNIKKISKVL